MEVAQRNGAFLATLNQEAGLSKYKSLSVKHKAVKMLFHLWIKLLEKNHLHPLSKLFLPTFSLQLQRVKNEFMKLPNKLFRWDAFIVLTFHCVTHSSTSTGGK